MTNPDHRIAVSLRVLRRFFAFACAASLLLASSTKANTILAYGQSSGTIAATESGGVTSITSADIPVLASSYLGVPQVPGLPMYETFNISSSGPAVDIGGTIFQAFNGTIAFYSGTGMTGIDYLTRLEHLR
jgi:hypothetical protein